MANKKTAKKKEEEKKSSTSSSAKSSTGKKKTASTKKSAGRKTASSSTKKTAKTGRKTTEKKKNSNKSKNGPAKIKVRVTQEEVSGIEEGMKEADYKKKKKTAASPDKTEKKKKDNPKNDKTQSPKKTGNKDKRKKKASSSKVGVATAKKENKQAGKDKNLWTSFAIGGDDEKEKKNNNTPKPHSISLYRKIAFTFIALTFLLLAMVFYFSATSLKITLYPAKERINDKMILDIYDKDHAPNNDALAEKSLLGIVDQLTINKSNAYKSTGEEVVGEEITGKVTIVNNYSQNQPLVASTRLLSPNDKLYRLAETVTVPAGGSVEVDIYTDNPSPEYAIGQTRFTIPGLWAGLQDDIYAETKKGFEYQTEKRKFIKKEDINNAIMDIKKELSQKAEREFGDNYLGYDEVIYDLVSVDANIEKEAGDEAEEFKVIAEGTINVTAFNSDKLEKIAESKLYSLLPENRELVEFNREEINYFLNNYNFSDRKATLEVSFSGKTVFKNSGQVVDKNNIVGLNKQQLKDYLDGLEEVSDYKISLSPSFVDTVPSLVDKIKIKVEE